MKKWIVLLAMMQGVWLTGSTQSHEAQQLLLNVTKLTQFRQILSDMKAGYEILVKGYTTIKDISEGNFNLHETFLDALYAVSPTVRQYKKVAGIIALQLKIVDRYKKGFNRFKKSGQFTVDEVEYMGRVYNRLVNESIKNLEDLAMVITAGQTRMSDDERLSQIDRIYAATEDQFAFLNDFNGRTSVLMVQRVKEHNDARVMRELYK